jgi:hypothetical protein
MIGLLILLGLAGVLAGLVLTAMAREDQEAGRHLGAPWVVGDLRRVRSHHGRGRPTIATAE